MRTPSAVSARAAFVSVLLVFGTGIAGCAGETGIIVEVSSPDLAAPADVDTLRFEATGALGVMAQGVFPITSPWPHSLAIRPRAGDDSGSVTVRVVGLKGGIEVATVTVPTAFRSGETVTVRAVLSRCVGAACMPVDGGMNDLGVDLGDDAGEPLDAGEDLGADDSGVVVDLGPGDLGMVDLGTPDAGVRDLGVDLGGTDLGPPDLGTDLGPIDMGFVAPLTGSLVISELAVGGPGTGTDEFVELYNRAATPLDIGGVAVEYASSAGTTYNVRATVPAGVVLPAHSYYLLGSVGYVGTVIPDQPMAWSTGLAVAGGHVRISRGTEIIDLFGWRTAMFPEGTSIAGPSGDGPGSYERKADAASTVVSMSAGGADVLRGNGQDTNNNSMDLIARLLRDPQNAASPPETP